MPLKIFKLFVLVLLFSSANKASAQIIKDIQVSSEQKAFTKWFDNQAGTETAPIYNGVTYPLRMIARNGHQFFNDNKWLEGNVCFEGQWYFDILLLYDIIDNQIVVKFQNNAISPDMSRIDYFTLGENSFLKVKNNNSEEFFQLLFKGNNVDLMAKHKKTLKLNSGGYEIEKSTSYFLSDGNELFTLRSKNTLKNISPDAKAIARRIKSKEAKFNLRKQNLLVAFIKGFDAEL